MGTTHEPSSGDFRGQILLAHGFKGYKDYGFIPWLAEHAAQAGLVAHRFNFSCSGMEHGHGPFDPSAFEQDTWNKQVEDVLSVLGAIQDGSVCSGGGVLLVGHSRGGVTSLLTAGRHAGMPEIDGLRGVVTLAAPSSCMYLDAADQARLQQEGFLSSPSSRTSQELRVGRGFLQEQLDDPEGHDLAHQASSIDVPVHVVHGMMDESVDITSAELIHAAVGSSCNVHRIGGANHVFNVPNPFPLDQEPSAELAEVGSIVLEIASDLGLRCC